MSQEFNRYAFISYNHNDVKWAKWLHKKLESYKLPSEIHNEFEDTRYLRPVFRDQDDLNTGILSEALRDNLVSSKYLVVICSPNSASSKWVNDEVRTFIELGRLDHIIPFIVDGQDHSYADRDVEDAYTDECFPLALRQLAKEDRTKELLGVIVAEVGRSKAFVRVVSRMLGVSFDTLWKRHQREKIRNIVITSVSMPVIAALVYWFAVPVKMSITLKDEPCNLPGMDKGTLYVNGSEYTITNPDTTIYPDNLPGYYRLKAIPISFKAENYYDSIDTEIEISAGVSQSETLQLRRDATFKFYSGTIMDEEGNPVPNATVDVEGRKAVTDADGKYSIEIPLAQQSVVKKIVVSCDGYSNTVRNEEPAGQDAIIQLHK